MTCASDRTSELPEARALARRHRLRADKRFGQHFLFDPALLARIAAAAKPFEGLRVVEVGAGPGGLTRALLAAGAEVIAIELDRRCLAALGELAEAAPGRLQLLAADAARTPLAALAQDRRLVVVGNLPFHISTVLLARWLRELDAIERMVLMFQKEVADRLLARPGSGAYGRLTVLAQRQCRIERLFELAPGAFHPPPKVRATVLRFHPRADRLDPPQLAALEQVTRAAFGQRRKMLKTSLRALGMAPEELLARAGVAANARAEELGCESFTALARAWAELNRRRAGAG